MRIALIAILLATPVLPLEIPARVEVTTPHRIEPGEIFSLTLYISPGSEGKTDYGVSGVNFALPNGLSGPAKLTCDKPKAVPFEIDGFSAENDGVYVLKGAVDTDRGELAFSSDPILCMRDWPTGVGTYYAAGIEAVLGKSVVDEKASLGIARRFGPEGNVYNEVVIWGPTVEYKPGGHVLTLEMRAEGGSGAYIFIADAQITRPGDREDEVEVIASRIITGATFPDDDEYYATSIEFNTYDEVEKLQVRLVYYGYAVLYVDRIIVE